MINHEKFERLVPVACEWVRGQQEFILACGVPLTEPQIEDARRAGVKDPSRVRVLVVDRIPLPVNPDLAEAARSTQIITHASHGLAFGYGIVIRADRWGDRELLVHNLVHVAQYENSADLESSVRGYIQDRRECTKFSVGSFEEEARSIARQICRGETAPTANS
jgi:hypothetical protein